MEMRTGTVDGLHVTPQCRSMVRRVHGPACLQPDFICSSRLPKVVRFGKTYFVTTEHQITEISVSLSREAAGRWERRPLSPHCMHWVESTGSHWRRWARTRSGECLPRDPQATRP